MKWTEIQEKHPKAWAALVKDHKTIEEWGEIDHPKIWDNDGCDISFVERRHLYDFFDAKGIHVEIVTDHTRHGYGIILFAWKIIEWEKANLKNNWSELERSRLLAESSAFTKAFEILEGRL